MGPSVQIAFSNLSLTAKKAVIVVFNGADAKSKDNYQGCEFNPFLLFSQKEEAIQKYNNFGYLAEENRSENVAAFPEDCGHLAEPPLEVTGQLDDRTKNI